MKFEHVKCNICKSDLSKPIGRRRHPNGDPELETHIVRCAACGLIYPDPMPVPDKYEIVGNFGDPRKYFSADVTEARIRGYERTIEAIEKLKPNRGSLLDVGCGRGELASVARKRNWRVTGTEVSDAFARYAKEKFDFDVTIGDVSDLDLPEESFDVACLSSVIQYVADPLRTLKKINSLLKPSGVLYIEVTNEDALIFTVGDMLKSIGRRERITTHLSPLFPSFQIYGFNNLSLSTALRKAGFEIRRIRICGVRGGGTVGGGGLVNGIINIARKLIILAGGLTGKGHLMYCLAEKRGT